MWMWSSEAPTGYGQVLVTVYALHGLEHCGGIMFMRSHVYIYIYI